MHNSERQNNTVLVHQSLEELDSLLSALEEQIKLGVFSEQQDREPVEGAILDGQASPAEDDSFWMSEFMS